MAGLTRTSRRIRKEMRYAEQQSSAVVDLENLVAWFRGPRPAPVQRGRGGHHVIPQTGKFEPGRIAWWFRKSCHYSVHAGGNYRTTAQYGFVRGLPLDEKIRKVAKLYAIPRRMGGLNQVLPPHPLELLAADAARSA